MRLLLIEDDRNLGKATAEGLKTTFAVDWVLSAEDAQEAVATHQYDLIVADINLPGASGLEFVSSLRNKKDQTAVLMLTARDAVRSRIEGLNAGADDYLIKPFDLDELLARCAALIRRSKGHAEPVIRILDIVFEPSTGKLEKNGSPVILSAREKSIFVALIYNQDRPVSKEKIEQRIYDWSSEEIESNTVEVHIAALRRKLGRDLIKQIRGVGYIIVS